MIVVFHAFRETKLQPQRIMVKNSNEIAREALLN